MKLVINWKFKKYHLNQIEFRLTNVLEFTQILKIGQSRTKKVPNLSSFMPLLPKQKQIANCKLGSFFFTQPWHGDSCMPYITAYHSLMDFGFLPITKLFQSIVGNVNWNTSILISYSHQIQTRLNYYHITTNLFVSNFCCHCYYSPDVIKIPSFWSPALFGPSCIFAAVQSKILTYHPP